MPTLVVKRLIKRGYEREYENTLASMLSAAEEMNGYLGANIARPGNKKKSIYIFSIKFDTKKHLEEYKNSSLRHELLKLWHDQSEKLIYEKTINGLNWWFISPEGNKEISRFKMIVISFIAAYPAVFVLSVLINGANDIGRTALKDILLVLTTILVMNYITMPFFLTALEKWQSKKFYENKSE